MYTLTSPYQVSIHKSALPSGTLNVNQEIERYDFEIVLSNKYPFRDPLILCHTDFTSEMLSLDDGRDLFSEIVGEGGWKVGHKLYSLI